MHLLNSLRYSMNKSKLVINEQFLKICAHFNKRTKQLKAAKEAEKQVEEYKYKTYGQKETAQELEDKELAEHFPTFVEYFNDFIRSESNDIKPIEKEPLDEEQTNETKNLIDQNLLSKTFDLIEMFIDFQHLDFELKDSDFFDKNQLNLFYKSYSLASKLLINNNLTLNCGKSLKSHNLFSSSINFDYSSFYISDNTNTKYIYDFYNDPNQTEAIKCKDLLKQFYKRIETLLNEWENNPILIELIKIVKRIESFDLNDSLMKYLTGVEIKLEQKQNNFKTFKALMHLNLKFKFESINNSDEKFINLLDNN